MESHNQQQQFFLPQQQHQLQHKPYFMNNPRNNIKPSNNTYARHQPIQNFENSNRGIGNYKDQNRSYDFNNNSSNYNNNNNDIDNSLLIREKLNKLSINVSQNTLDRNGRQFVTQTSPPNKTSSSFQQNTSPLVSKINDQPIWKSYNYDPNTSIYLIIREKVDRKYLLNKEYLKNISLKTNTKIDFHSNGDLNEMNTTIYFTVTGIYEARCSVLEMLQAETNKAGVIINLPSLVPADDLRKSQIKTNLNCPANSQVRKKCTFLVDDSVLDNSQSTSPSCINNQQIKGNFKRTKSFHDKFDLEKSQYQQYNSILQSPSISSTSSSSYFSNDSNNSGISTRRKYSQGSSLMMPLEDKRISYKNITTQKCRKRYDIDFLLSRADATQSKQLPKDWPELNVKYPNICFCGKVISYFNPHIYQAYWMKIKKSNEHLHV